MKREKLADIYPYPYYFSSFCFVCALAAAVLVALAGMILSFVVGYAIAAMSTVFVLVFNKKIVGRNSAVLLYSMIGAYVGSIIADVRIASVSRLWDDVWRDMFLLFVIYFQAFVIVALKRVLWEGDVIREK